MPVETTFIAWSLPMTAMAAGFLGSVHCLGMCGGVSGTMALATKPPATVPSIGLLAVIPASTLSRTRTGALVNANVLAFNTGRIVSYSLAGALAGSAGGVLGQTWVVGETFPARAALFLFANLMIVLIGLYVMGIPQLLAPLERAGGRIWRYLSPIKGKFLPINTAPRAAAFGMLWGWIPCGLVYAMLFTAMGAGSSGAGAVTMMAFGIGTLPAMISAGLMAGQLRRWTRDSRVRLVTGAAVIALGLFGFVRAESLASLQSFGAFCVSIAQEAL